MKDLANQIEELNENLAQQLPAEVLEIFGKSIQDLKAENMEESSISIGEKFPDFSLLNSNGKVIVLKELLKNGKVIVAFFRGNWCPYCNLELKALQYHLKTMAEKNTTLVAVSPQTIHYSEELKNNHHLDFDLLTDTNNALAKKLGILCTLQDYVIPVYNSLGIDLSDYNKNDNNELPVPAVFIIDTNFTIIYKFADTDYMHRIDIEELIAQL